MKAALSKFHADAAVALGTKKTYRLVVVGHENQMCAMMVARKVLGWRSAESREKLSHLPAVLIESEDYARIEALANQFSHNNVNVSIETRNGLGELINTTKMVTAREIAAEEKQNEDVDDEDEYEVEEDTEDEEETDEDEYEVEEDEEDDTWYYPRF